MIRLLAAKASLNQMRVAYFHNWSWLGSAVARALLELGRDDLWLIGAPAPLDQRDLELEAHAGRAGMPLGTPADVGAPDFLAALSSFAPDLVLVVTFARKLADPLLAVPRLAAINLHPSLLPAYRGAMPEFWALRNGEPASGLTAHLMTSELDAGPILASTRVALRDDDDLVALSERLVEAAPPLALGLLERYRQGERPAGIEQDHARATRAPYPTDRHLAVQWTEPAPSIERLVRAARPRFAAHTRFRGERLIVRRARTADPGDDPLTPGVLSFDPGSEQLRVGAGGGTALVIEELELTDGQRLGPRAFASTFALAPGTRLGT